MEVSVLGSGSSGNSVFVKTRQARLLFDAGFSARETKRRLSAVGEDIDDVDAVFISHEHSDHVKGVRVLSRNLAVHIDRQTYDSSCLNIEHPHFFRIGDEMMMGDSRILPISTSHDAANPCGFIVRENGTGLGIFTDLGCVTPNMIESLNGVGNLVLESNHDVDMLISGSYPSPLKQRILGSQGHLSNIDASLYVRDYGQSIKNVILAHLSRHNNTPELALNTFESIAGKKIEPMLADQDIPTEMLTLR